MTLEAGREMDKRCVLNWLNEVYVTPSRAFNEYTEDELKMFAHDALAMLKEQEAVEPTVSCAEEHDGHGSWWYQCGKCRMPIDYGDGFCRRCGHEVKWK